jgi:hypothetical protein
VAAATEFIKAAPGSPRAMPMSKDDHRRLPPMRWVAQGALAPRGIGRLLPEGCSGRSIGVTVDQKTLREIVLTLLAARISGATICPSEVARASVTVAERTKAVAQEWRDVMPDVHAVVDRLLAERLVQLSWKGEPLTTRMGPYRIGRAPAA